MSSEMSVARVLAKLEARAALHRSSRPSMPRRRLTTASSGSSTKVASPSAGRMTQIVHVAVPVSAVVPHVPLAPEEPRQLLGWPPMALSATASE